METLTELVSTFIVNALWQISALLIIAIICAQVIRRVTVARHQYLFWVAVFILSVSLPVLSLYNFRDNSKFIFRLPLENNHAEIYQDSNTRESTEDKLLIQSREQSSGFDISIVLLVVSICYFSFLFYRLIYLLETWRRTARLRHLVKYEKLPPQINAVAERCCAAFQIEFVPISFSAQVAAPLTLGARKPLIILPESFLKITCEKTLTAVLGHELAHVRRYDYGFNLVYEFLSLLVSFHPAVTIMKRKINQTREMACDELVAKSLLNPLDYTRLLVQIAGFITSSSHNAYTLGVFSADILEKRIMKLIEISRGTNPRLGKIRFLFAITILGITGMVTSVFSLAVALGQEQEIEKNVTVNGGILNSKALNLAKPAYPPAAKAVNASGTVIVEIIIDEKGNVISAKAVSGHPLLKKASVNAAKESQFAPILLEGKPVKVSGILVYDFSSATDEPTEINVDSNNIKGGVVNGKAISLPQPEYPPAAKAVKASGIVNVQVTIDEDGNVISAEAVSGHPLLRSSAVTAAKQAKFAPIFLSGKAVKVTGVLVYDFILPEEENK